MISRSRNSKIALIAGLLAGRYIPVIILCIRGHHAVLVLAARSVYNEILLISSPLPSALCIFGGNIVTRRISILFKSTDFVKVTAF
jgi:hypothetical protein